MAGVDDSICADLGAAMALNAVERITIAGDNKSKSSVSFGGATSIITACGAALERLDMGSSQLNVPALDVFSVLNTHCVSLRRLDLSKCGITTFLPKERSAWRWAQHLVHLNLEENPLQGELHEVLAQLPSLSELLLGYTKLAGTIPEDIATTGNMRKLDVTATGLKPGQQARWTHEAAAMLSTRASISTMDAYGFVVSYRRKRHACVFCEFELLRVAVHLFRFYKWLKTERLN